MSLFWSVLALFYLALATVTFITTRPIQRNLATIKKQIDMTANNEKGETISQGETLYRAFKGMTLTDIIGFILAAAAAIMSSNV